MDALRTEASAEGFRLLDRLIRDWEAGANRFDQPGECLLGAWSEAELVGVGGLNRDPYVEGSRIGQRHGAMFRIERRASEFLAQGISPIAIIPCEGARDKKSETALAEAFKKRGGWLLVTRLYRHDDVARDRSVPLGGVWPTNEVHFATRA